MIQQEEKSSFDELSAGEVSDRILAFNAKIHDPSISPAGQAKAQALRDVGLIGISDWKGDKDLSDLHRQLLMAIDGADRRAEKIERQAALDRGDPVEMEARFFGGLARKTPENEKLTGQFSAETEDPLGLRVRIQNVDGVGTMTGIRQHADGSIEEFGLFDPRDQLTHEEDRPNLRPSTVNLFGTGRPRKPFESIPRFQASRRNALEQRFMTGAIASVPLLGKFDELEDERQLRYHDLGDQPFRDTPNLYTADGKLLTHLTRSSDVGIGDRILNTFTGDGFVVDDKIYDMSARVTDPEILRSNDIIYNPKQFDELGRPFVVDRNGEVVQLYPKLIVGTEITLPDGTIKTIGGEDLEEMVDSLHGGGFGPGILGHFFHDESFTTSQGEFLVPNLTGNSVTDRELMEDPVFFRSYLESEGAGQEFQTAFLQTATMIGEFGAVGKLFKGLGSATRVGGKAIIATNTGRRFLKPLFKRFSALPVQAAGKRIFGAQGLGSTVTAGTRAVPKAVMTYGDAIGIAEMTRFEMTRAVVRGEPVMPAAIHGFQTGVGLNIFGKAARVSRRVAGKALSLMTKRRINLDKTALLAGGLDDSVTQQIALNATRTLRGLKGSISRQVASKAVMDEVGPVMRSLKLQAGLESTFDAGAMGVFFGAMGSAEGAAAQDGQDFASLDLAQKFSYFRDGLTSPEALAGATAFMAHSAAHTALNMRGPSMKNMPEAARQKIDDIVESVTRNTISRAAAEDPNFAMAGLLITEPALEAMLKEMSTKEQAEFNAELSERSQAGIGHPDPFFQEVGGELNAGHVGAQYLRDGGPAKIQVMIELAPTRILREFQAEVRSLPLDQGEPVNRINAGRHLNEMIATELVARDVRKASEAQQLKNDRATEAKLEEAADLADQSHVEPAGSLVRPVKPVEIATADIPSFFDPQRIETKPDGQQVRFTLLSNRNLAVTERPDGRFEAVSRRTWRTLPKSPSEGFETMLEAQAWVLKTGRVGDSPLARMTALGSKDAPDGKQRHGRPETRNVDPAEARALLEAMERSYDLKRQNMDTLAELERQSLIEDIAAGFDIIPESRFTLPETAETLSAQLKSMRAGNKPAVLYRDGDAPRAKPNERRVRVDEGVILATKAPGLAGKISALKAGKISLSEFLGLGVEQRGETKEVVTALDAEGQTVVDIQSAATPEVVAAAKRIAGETGSVQVRTVNDVLIERAQAAGVEVPKTVEGQPAFGAGLEPPLRETVIQARADVYEALLRIPGNELKTEPELVDAFMSTKHYATSARLRSRVRDARAKAASALRKVATARKGRKPRLSTPKQRPDQKVAEVAEAAGRTSPEREVFHKEIETEIVIEQAVEASRVKVEELTVKRENSASELFKGPEAEAAFRTGTDMLSGTDSKGGRSTLTTSLEMFKQAATFVVQSQMDKGPLRSFAAGLLYRLSLPKSLTAKGQPSKVGTRRLEAVAKMSGLTLKEVEGIRDQLLADARTLGDPAQGPRREIMQTILGGKLDLPATQELLQLIALSPPGTDNMSGRLMVPEAGRLRKTLEDNFKLLGDSLARKMKVKPNELQTAIEAPGGILDRFTEGATGLKSEVRDLRATLLRTIGAAHGKKDATASTRIEALGNRELSEITDGLIKLLTRRESTFAREDAFDHNIKRETDIQGEGTQSIEQYAIAGQKAQGELVTASEAVENLRADNQAPIAGGTITTADMLVYTKAAASGRDALNVIAKIHLQKNGIIDPLLNDLDLPPGRPVAEGFFKTRYGVILMGRLAHNDPGLRTIFSLATDAQGRPLYETPEAASRAFESARASSLEAILSAQQLAVRLSGNTEAGDGGQATQNVVEAFFRAREAQSFSKSIDPKDLDILRKGDSVLFPEGSALEFERDVLRVGAPEVFSKWIHENMTEAIRQIENNQDLTLSNPMLLYGGIVASAADGFLVAPNTLDPVTGHGKFNLRFDKTRGKAKTFLQEYTKNAKYWETPVHKKMAQVTSRLMAKLSDLGRGQTGIGLTENLTKANRETRRIRIKNEQNAIHLREEMGGVMNQIERMQLTPDAMSFVSKFVEGGGIFRFPSIESFTKAFGQNAAPLYDLSLDVAHLFNRAGWNMVMSGVITPAQFREGMYIPAILRPEGKFADELRRALSKGRAPETARELPRGDKTLERIADKTLFLNEALPVSIIQESTRTMTLGTLNDIRHALSFKKKAGFDELSTYEAAQWAKAEEAAAGRKLSTESTQEFEARMFSLEEHQAIADGRITPEQKAEIVERRGTGDAVQVRLSIFLEHERKLVRESDAETQAINKKFEKDKEKFGSKAKRGKKKLAPVSDIKRSMLEDFKEGYITRNTLFELDLLLDHMEPTEIKTDNVRDMISTWQRMKTIESSQHWATNIGGSVISNSATGKVGMKDFITSITTGKGSYAEAGEFTAEHMDWVDAGRPSLESYSPIQRQRIEFAERFRDALGANTHGAIMTAPGNMSELFQAYGAIDPREAPSRGGSGQRFVDSVGTFVKRRATWQNTWDKMRALISGDPNPIARAASLHRAESVYQTHEAFYKMAATINLMKSGMNFESAVEIGAQGTADYGDRSAKFQKMLSRHNFALSPTEAAATRLAGTRSIFGLRKIGEDAVTARNHKRVIGKMVSGPFWQYSLQMIPTYIEAGFNNPLALIASLGTTNAVFSAIFSEEDDPGKFQDAISGLDTFLDVDLIDEGEEWLLADGRGDEKVGGWFNGAGPASDGLTMRRALQLRRMHLDFMRSRPGVKRGGRSTVVDTNQLEMGAAVLSDMASGNPLKVIERNLNVGFLPTMALAAMNSAVDFGRAKMSDDPDAFQKQMVLSAFELFKNTNSDLGGGFPGSIFSNTGRQSARTFSLDQRTLSELVGGQRRPLNRLDSLGQRAKTAVTDLLLPVRDMPSGRAHEDQANAGMIERSFGNPFAELLEGGRVESGPEEALKLKGFSRALSGQMSDFAADAYIAMSELGVEDASISSSGMLRQWLDIYVDAIPDDTTNGFTLASSPQTEIGKFVRSHAGDDKLLQSAMIQQVTVQLDQWSGKVGQTLETLMNKERIDPAIVRRMAAALFSGTDEGSTTINFLATRMLGKNPDTENAGIYYELLKGAQLDSATATGADGVLLEKLIRKFRELGADGDIDFVSPEAKRQAFRKAIGAPLPDVAPNLLVDELLRPRKKQ